MALPQLDFSDVQGLATPTPALPSGDGGGLPQLDFSDVMGMVPQKTGQEKAQDIARTAGIAVSPEFGGSMLDRLTADFGKGLATSIPGRLVGKAIGSGETANQLAELPSSQPIPYLPDLDTVGTLVGDGAMFSLVPAAALPGKIVGRALGSAVGGRLKDLPHVQAALAKGSLGHVGISQKLTGELLGTTRDLFEAAGGMTSAGFGFGGLSKVAGVSDEEAGLQGALAAVAGGMNPAFRALKSAAVLKRMTSDRYLEAERALAEFFDTHLGKKIAQNRLAGIDPSPAMQEKILMGIGDELEPGFGRKIADVHAQLTQPGGFKANIPELRELVDSWDDVTRASMRGRVEKTFLDRGWTAAYNAHAKFTKSVDTTLRRLGPAGVALANGIRGGLNESDRLYGKYAAPLNKAMKGVTRKQFDEWVELRERGMAPAGTAESTGTDYLSYFLDEIAPRDLEANGLGLEDLRKGFYMPRHLDLEGTERWMSNPDNISRLAETTGLSFGEASKMAEDFLDGVTNLKEAPVTNIMRSSIDLERTLPLSTAQMRKLGIPMADNSVALNRYVRQLSDRIGYAKHFHADGSRLGELMDDLKSKGPHRNKRIAVNLIEESVRKAVGLDGEVGDVSRVFGWLGSNVLVPTHLGLASISNIGQGVNTIAKVGLRPYIRGLREMRREAKLAKSNGVAPSQLYSEFRAFTDDVSNAVGDFFTGSEKSNSLLRPKAPGRESFAKRLNLGGFILHKTGFNSIEQWNRMGAAYAGKRFLEDSVTKAVRGGMSPKQLSRMGAEFKRLGLDFDDIVSRGAMSDEELTRGALRISDITQHRIRPFDLPLFWSSPNAAAFRMLKTFAFNQGKFLRQHVFGDAREYAMSGGKRGSMRPMAFFLSGYPAAGAGIGAVRSAIKGETPFEDQSPMGAYLTSMAWVGGLGLAADFAKSLDAGSKAILQFGAGPLVSDAIDLVDAAVHAPENPDRLGRTLLRKLVPGVSQNIGGVGRQLEEALGFKEN